MHPSTQHIINSFSSVPMDDSTKEVVSALRASFQNLAVLIAETSEGPDTTHALRALMTAKDDAIRAAIFSPKART